MPEVTQPVTPNPATEAAASSAAPGEPRHPGLDALRGSMMLMGILLHGAVFYLAAPPAAFPMPTDRSGGPMFDVLFHFIHSFRMPAFFLLAGFFAALLWQKRGWKGFYRNRLARIAAPLLASMVFLLPFMGLFMMNFMLAARFGVHAWWPDLALMNQLGREMMAAGAPVNQIALGNLWFLHYLCWFYLMVPLWQVLVSASEPHAARWQSWFGSPWALLLFSLVTAATLWPFHGGQVHEGFMFLTPHVPSLAYFGFFFMLGYFIHRHREFLDMARRDTVRYGVIGFLLFPPSLYLSAVDVQSGSANWHLAAVLVHALCTWALITACIGGALRFLDRASPWSLYLAQSAYWVYLLHVGVAAFVAWWLVPYDWPGLIKFLLVVTVTTVVCFLSYHYLVQGTFMGRFLNGRRLNQDWPWRSKANLDVNGV